MCVCVHQYIYIYPCVWVCVSAKCHIDRLIAAVSDSVTLWLVDSSLIHTPSWVIGPAHWFPACQPSQEELRGRKRACRYWLAPDQPHHHLPITHTHQTQLQSYGMRLYKDRFFLHFYGSSHATYPPSCLAPQCTSGYICVMSWCHLHQSIFFLFCSEIFLLTDFMSGRRYLTKLPFSLLPSLLHCQYFYILSYLHQYFKVMPLLLKYFENQKSSLSSVGLKGCL